MRRKAAAALRIALLATLPVILISSESKRCKQGGLGIAHPLPLQLLDSRCTPGMKFTHFRCYPVELHPACAYTVKKNYEIPGFVLTKPSWDGERV